ncbi:DUF3047 domain-containing protein [Marivivens sp. JLT3646]|uniref:DUF3047 domain-containing protein n=1 Tax=Marivivens sp. JLT3646 TaxID=1920883 RepID=UPI000800C194|nr:DUF3047 domain-containing protein [Marivivens sp. JLT3646]APO88498.1 hypothetical protein BSK21_15235 [Marivivens sp. JLT3646]OBR39310.1 hypothetical protein A9199_12645 [Donghicola sp. JL3646]
MRNLIATLLTLAATSAAANPFPNWTEQKFALFSSNGYTATANAVDVQSAGTVSMLWTALDPSDWSTRRASWDWSVATSVPPTDLTQKGGDDRNLSLYFVFMPEEIAQQNQSASIRTLLSVEEARVLMYVFGGDHQIGDVLPSPYLGDRGRMIIRRAAGTGTYTETVDLAADYERAFGGNATALVGLALSADSDDTDSKIVARLENLKLD